MLQPLPAPRTLLGLALMAAQAFFYNAIFFTYALVLTDFYGIAVRRVGWYMLPFALGNLLGPLLLGRLFDTIGRRLMIALTYGLVGGAARRDRLTCSPPACSTRATQTVAWTCVFFFASAAASCRLPDRRARCFRWRCARSPSRSSTPSAPASAASRPALAGRSDRTGSRGSVAIGYFSGAALMIGAAAVEAIWGIAAERKPLEEVSRPLSLVNS